MELFISTGYACAYIVLSSTPSLHYLLLIHILIILFFCIITTVTLTYSIVGERKKNNYFLETVSLIFFYLFYPYKCDLLQFRPKF